VIWHPDTNNDQAIALAEKVARDKMVKLRLDFILWAPDPWRAMLRKPGATWTNWRAFGNIGPADALTRAAAKALGIEIGG
jgi:hypothetical protein